VGDYPSVLKVGDLSPCPPAPTPMSRPLSTAGTAGP